jgi:Ca2+-dependent lipid-binding protein
VNEDSSNGLEMELGIRWSGDANITLAIELPTGGNYTRICPSVEGISFAGTLRVRLYPLCNTIPGFGGAMVTFPKQPRFKYHLNFGKLGGSVTAAPVKMFVNSMVKNILNDMLVWPQRLVVPIIPNIPAVSQLFYRHQGILKVDVIKAEKLVAADMNLIGANSSDPIASLTTDGQYVVETKCIKKTLEPVW